MEISHHLNIPETEIEITFVRAQGAGGQNVNKVASAAHLRFDIPASSLPEAIKERLLALRDNRKARLVDLKSHLTRLEAELSAATPKRSSERSSRW